MKIVKILFAIGTLALIPEIAQADRCKYGRSNYSRPSYSHNSYWNRPASEHYGNRYGNRFTYGNGFFNQDPRVGYGIQSGQLSRNELQELMDRQREIEQQRQSYWSDGYLSKNERKELERDQRNYDKYLNHNLSDGERANRRWFNRWW